MIGKEVGNLTSMATSSISALHNVPCKHVSTVHITQNVKLTCCHSRTLMKERWFAEFRYKCCAFSVAKLVPYLLAYISLSIANCVKTAQRLTGMYACFG
jgi:hypothetical protein